MEKPGQKGKAIDIQPKKKKTGNQGGMKRKKGHNEKTKNKEPFNSPEERARGTRLQKSRRKTGAQKSKNQWPSPVHT